MKEIEKVVYLSHCFGGNQDNVKHAEEVIIRLQHQFPDITFLSPLHALGYAYHLMSYDEGMRHCLALLDMADEMWLVDGYDYSKGCLIERDYCKQYKIPMKMVRDCGRCEWNEYKECGKLFCVVPRCIK